MSVKKAFAICLSSALILCSASQTFASEAIAPARTVASLAFTGPVIALTLDQAKQAALTSGSAIQAAEIKKKSDEANAKGNAESLSSMNTANSESKVYTKSQLEKASKSKDYYKNMAARNYEAAKNQIVYDITEAYYTLLHAEGSLQIAQENLVLQENLLAVVNKKFSLGVSSKQEVLQTEISTGNARANLNAAELALADKKMSFNITLGLDPMQEVTLTTPLSMTEHDPLPLEAALKGALENRNELYSCAYNIFTAEKEIDGLNGYPKSSSKYLNASNNLNSAQKAYDDKENALQKEVRINYATMNNNDALVNNARNSESKAKESYSILLAKYDLGLSTLYEVQQAQIDRFNAENSYAEAVLKYNLSVLKYEQSATVGTSQNQQGV